MAVVHTEDELADADVFGVDGERGEAADALQVATVLLRQRGFHEVVRDVDPVEAGAVGPAPELAQLRQVDVLLDEVQAEFHGGAGAATSMG